VSSKLVEPKARDGSTARATGLTRHQQDRARFVLACAMHGKLKSVDEVTAREVVRFARSPANPFPGEPMPSLNLRLVAAARGTSREARPRVRRSGGSSPTRGSPRLADDDPKPPLARPARQVPA
jgi:hypothetical protein